MVRVIVIPSSEDKVVLSVNAITGVTTYGGYRITRIKGGRIGEWKTEEAKEERRETSKRERPPLTSTPGWCAPVANSSSYLRLSPLGADPPRLPLPATRALLCPRRARTRSSSVIDRNLSLTSLPPGAKILPGPTG